MFIPFISKRAVQPAHSHEKRRGGGGRGGGGGVSRGGSSGGSSTGAKGASSAGKPPAYSPGAPPPPYSVAGGTAVRGATGSTGGGRSYTIAGGNAFAGRSAGGGTRGTVYGGRGYGARGYAPFFPFMFWPVFFPIYPYYYGSSIYGPRDNSSRPGGELQSFTLLPTWASEGQPNNGAVGPSSNTFALYGDVNSVNDMVSVLSTNCSVVNATYGANVTASPFNAVQYYRGDSFVLLLDGYNNSLPNIEVQDPSQNFTVPDATPAPLPNTVNATYFECLNQTIGSYVGLLDSDYVTDAASHRLSPAGLSGSVALAAVLLKLLI